MGVAELQRPPLRATARAMIDGGPAWADSYGHRNGWGYQNHPLAEARVMSLGIALVKQTRHNKAFHLTRRKRRDGER